MTSPNKPVPENTIHPTPEFLPQLDYHTQLVPPALVAHFLLLKYVQQIVVRGRLTLGSLGLDLSAPDEVLMVLQAL